MLRRQPELYPSGRTSAVYNQFGAWVLYLFTPERGDTFREFTARRSVDTVPVPKRMCLLAENDQMTIFMTGCRWDTRVVLYRSSDASDIRQFHSGTRSCGRMVEQGWCMLIISIACLRDVAQRGVLTTSRCSWDQVYRDVQPPWAQ
jgi:hypothetical protein